MPNLVYFVAALLSGLGQPQVPPDVKVERTGEAAFRLTVTAEGTQDPRAAQALLNPAAARLCGELPARYGRYEFTADGLAPGQPGEATDSVTLIQNLTCGEPAPEPAAPAVDIALTQADIDVMTPVILDLSSQYFTAVEQGRDGDAFALTTPDMTGGSLDDWMVAEARRREVVGPLVSRQVARLSWYPNPPDSPQPGLYVAVDYVAGWTRQDECGYLVWFRPDAETAFRLARQERTLLPHDLDAGTRSALRARYCIIL